METRLEISCNWRWQTVREFQTHLDLLQVTAHFYIISLIYAFIRQIIPTLWCVTDARCSLSLSLSLSLSFSLSLILSHSLSVSLSLSLSLSLFLSLSLSLSLSPNTLLSLSLSHIPLRKMATATHHVWMWLDQLCARKSCRACFNRPYTKHVFCPASSHHWSVTKSFNETSFNQNRQLLIFIVKFRANLLLVNRLGCSLTNSIFSLVGVHSFFFSWQLFSACKTRSAGDGWTF